MTFSRLFCALFSYSFLAGCAVVPTPYDYSMLENNIPRSILVIPPINNSVEVNAAYSFVSTISKPLAERGYYVFPVAVIDNFFKENGLPTPEEMNAVTLDMLVKNIGPDAVLYITIEEWGQKFQLVSSSTVIEANLRLVDARSSALLWEGEIDATSSSFETGSGVAGMLVGAIAYQIIGSITDATRDYSSVINNRVLNDPEDGLLAGPYLASRELE